MTEAELMTKSQLKKLEKRRSNYPWAREVTNVFPMHADLMDQVVKSEARRYRRFGRWHMWWFRVGGFFEILLSVSFPFVISILPNDSQSANMNNRIITGISVGIALVGSVQAFYAWSDNWRLYRSQKLALDRILRKWEIDLLGLTLVSQVDQMAAYAATKAAIDNIGRALEYEQDVFFGSVRLPEDLLAQGRQNDEPEKYPQG